ncbi:MAG: triose-phosphate isomerase [Chthonomonas sp.]|nr:triose-phosphate isomerase [Chthonomonas sp.]
MKKRRPLVAGNWKMNYTAAEAAAVVQQLLRAVAMREDVDVVLCPSFLSLWRVHDVLKGERVQLGAQDVFWAASGAFTGSVSATMLAEAGVSYCVVGHSETRGRFGKLEVPENAVGYFAETDETVRLKIEALLGHGIAPILCVGETLAEREAGQTDEVIAAQLRGALAGFDEAELAGLVIAYEPVWAIGTGKVCEVDEAERVCATLRHELEAMLGEELAERTRVLYGGSVKPDNARALFDQPNIDGGLVGGASLKADDFSKVIAAANA